MHASNKNVQRILLCATKVFACAQVYKLMCDTHLIVLHVPALDHFVKPGREHVWMAVTHRQACHLQHHHTMTSSTQQGCKLDDDLQ